MDERRAGIEFIRQLFKTSNLIATDFDDVRIFEVKGRHFRQQSDGAGLHVSFSVSWHAIGKTNREAHHALDVLIPDDEND